MTTFGISGLVNRVRRENAALQHNEGLIFHSTLTTRWAPAKDQPGWNYSSSLSSTSIPTTLRRWLTSTLVAGPGTNHASVPDFLSARVTPARALTYVQINPHVGRSYLRIETLQNERD